MPENGTTNGDKAKFQIVHKSSYLQLQAIVKKRLPVSVQFYNALQLSLTGENEFEFYTYQGILNDSSIVVGTGTMKKKETDIGTLLAFLLVPKPESVTPEFAKDFVTHFTRPDRDLSYSAERHSSPYIVQALLNQGHVLTIRSCDIVCLLDPTIASSAESAVPADGYIVKELEPENAKLVADSWSYGLWSQPEAYVRMCVERNPSGGIYAADTHELMSWVICYNFGSLGMLFTPEKYRGRGFGKIVMRHIMKAMAARGIIPVTGVEPRNEVSRKVLTQLGFETTHAMDFIYTS